MTYTTPYNKNFQQQDSDEYAVPVPLCFGTMGKDGPAGFKCLKSGCMGTDRFTECFQFSLMVAKNHWGR